MYSKPVSSSLYTVEEKTVAVKPKRPSTAIKRPVASNIQPVTSSIIEDDSTFSMIIKEAKAKNEALRNRLVAHLEDKGIEKMAAASTAGFLSGWMDKRKKPSKKQVMPAQ